MGNENKKLLAGICVLLISLVAFGTAATANADEITITGTVVAMDWDDKDNAIAVSIETDDELYYVSDNPIGKKFLALLGKGVTVTGVLGEDAEGNATITVDAYEELSD